MTPRRALAVGSTAFVLLWPLIPGVPYSFLGDAILASYYVIVGVSLVLLTGWVGQISLGQAALVGIGAFSTGLLTRKAGLPFPFTLPVAALAGALAATVLGAVALRVRGLYLAVATLIFSWMADAYLFNAPWFVGAGGSSSIRVKAIGRAGAIPYLDFTQRRTFYYVALAVAVIALYSASNLRESKTGRAFFAVRGSEVAAAALGIDVTRYKLIAFATSGFLAGMAGNIVLTAQRTAVPAQFGFTVSLFFLSVAVVGGLTSLGGLVASSVLFAGLGEVFYRFPSLGKLQDLIAVGLLAVVLTAYRGGLARIPQDLSKFIGKRRPVPKDPQIDLLQTDEESWDEPVVGRSFLDSDSYPASRDPLEDDTNDDDDEEARLSDILYALGGPFRNLRALSTRTLGTVARRWKGLGPHIRTARTSKRTPVAPSSDVKLGRGGKPVLLEAKEVTIRFGGLVAVNEVSLSVCQGEIVGLIGPNGAGKTTTFNAISGLAIPSSGRVELFGKDVTDLPVHGRAVMGLGRTFQIIQLFRQLTVIENLLVATHLHNSSSFGQHLFLTRHAAEQEEEARHRVSEILKSMELEELGHRTVAGLPFGVLRMVEIARALVTEAPLILLDEPASGLDDNETERLVEILFRVKNELGRSMLLIEHDVRMVTSVSDYMYVLDMGSLLSEGTPDQIRSDPTVVAAYLGEEHESADTQHEVGV